MSKVPSSQEASFYSGENLQRYLEAVCNNASVALFITDERQYCVYMNPAAERLTGSFLNGAGR